VTGLGQKFMTWVGPGQFFAARVSRLWFGFGKFLPKVLNFSIFPFRDKKISSGISKSNWVKDGFLFTADQRLAKVKSGWGLSGQGPSLVSKVN